MPFLRKYNTLLVTGTTAIRVPIVKRSVVDFAVSADWTPAAGDVKILVDGTAAANVTNLPTAVAGANTGAIWEFVLTAAELSCKQAVIIISDAATKAIEDQCFLVETYGNASAMYAADLSAANLPANVTQLLGTAWLTPATAGTPDVNAKQIGATPQTGRDLGTSVLLSSGTGTGQLDFTSGVVKANLAQILGTALTETAGQIAAAFIKFFNKATPTGTVNSLPDAVAGASSGLALVGSNVGAATSVSGAVGSVTGNVGGSVASVTADVGITQAGADKVWGSATRSLTTFGTLVADTAAAVWASVTRTLSAISDSSGVTTLLSRITGALPLAADYSPARASKLDNLDATVNSRLAASGYTAPDNADVVTALADLVTLLARNTPLDAAGVRTALGLATANLDTQLAEANADLDELITTLGTPVLADLSHDIASRLAASGYTAPSNPSDYARNNAAPSWWIAPDNADVVSALVDLMTLLARATPLDAAGVRAALGLALANLDTQIAAITALDAAGVRSAVGLTTADLDTQLGVIASTVSLVQAKTDNLPSDPADASDIATSFSGVNAILGSPAGASLASDIAAIVAGVAPSAATVAAEVNTVLSGAHGSGEWDVSQAATLYGESGEFPVTIDTFDTDGSTALPACSVWVSRDSEGIQRSQAKLSDASGRVTFTLDAGTIYIWRSRIGRTFSNPESEMVG